MLRRISTFFLLLVLYFSSLSPATSLLHSPLQYLPLNRRLLPPSLHLSSRSSSDGGASLGYGDGLIPRFGTSPPPDLASELLSRRIISLSLPLSPPVTELVISQLLHLNEESRSTPIKIYINTPTSAPNSQSPLYNPHLEVLSILDVMSHIHAPVHTLCLGRSSGAATLLLCSGLVGKRAAMPGSEIVVADDEGLGVRIWGSGGGDALDIAGRVKEAKLVRQVLCRRMAERCGKKEEDIAKDWERGRNLTCKEAVEYGIIDKIITKGALDDSM